MGCRPAKAKLVEVVVGVLEVNLIVVVVVEGVQEGVEGGLTLAEISHMQALPGSSRQLCYGYITLDNRPCNKTRTSDGCTDGIRSFTHLYNKILPGGAMCLQKHPKSLHPA